MDPLLQARVKVEQEEAAARAAPLQVKHETIFLLLIFRLSCALE